MGVALGRKRAWWSTVFLIGLVLVLMFVVSGPGGVRAVHAQQAEGGEAAAGAADEYEEPNLLEHIIKSAGWVFGPLLLIVSIALVTLIVILAMDLRLNASIPPDFVEEFTDTVNKRQFKQAFEMARNDNSYVARVLTAGMGRLQYGIEDAREAALNMTESVKAGKETFISYLATIGTLGPMLGLVGTVFGMIQSFMVLSIPGKTAAPNELAEGISHALVVTLLGIALSVPAIFCHNFFRNRLIRLAMDSSSMADDLLTQMYHNSKRPASSETSRASASVEGRAATAAIKPAE